MYFNKDTTINEKHKISFELKMLRQIISHIINVEFQIASLLEDKTTCSITCEKTNGRMAFIKIPKRNNSEFGKKIKRKKSPNKNNFIFYLAVFPENKIKSAN